MSATTLDLTTLIAQMPYAAKIASVEKAAPEVQKQIYGPLVNDQIRDAESKVPQVNKKEGTDPVDQDGHQQGQQASPDAKGQRRKKEKDTDDDDSNPSNPSPWTGNIVNVKI